VIDELPVEVLDAPLNLALVLRVRRKRKMSVDAKKLNNLLHAQSIRRRLNSYNFDAGLDYGKTTGSKSQKIAQLFEQKFYGLFEHMSIAFSLKASEAGSIVCTIAAGKVRTILQ
jgi:hypothetical protein